MSGFVALAHFDGEPVERELLDDLVASMAFRGPDGCRSWSHGSAGLGFAKMATTSEAEREWQPLSLDGKTWIAADARVDGRAELILELEAGGREEVHDATDAQLLLHAYGLWGESAPEHLLGDFAFAIWDSERRRLLCARDHFGVKPLFFSAWDNGVVVGNTLQTLLRHPKVSGELDEAAIADYLLFGSNLEPDTTSYRFIRRLAPGHAVSWQAGSSQSCKSCRSWSYWRLPTAPGAKRLGGGELVESFSALLGRAVADRLRAPRVSILMSGGLDSTAIATVAAEASRAGSPGSGSSRIDCYTQGYDRLAADPETPLARQVATELGLGHHYQPLDAYLLGERWGELPLPPQPGEHIWDAMYHDTERELALSSRVALTGFGGDVILLAEAEYLSSQLRDLRVDRALGYLLGALARGLRPPLGLHTRWRRRRIERHWRDGYPGWMNRELERRLGLVDRWRWFHLDRGPERQHTLRPRSHIELSDLGWANIFESFDPGTGIQAVEKRHPFFDLRLVELLLSTSPAPWCLEKHLLRRAMRGRLPELVRRRKKTPLRAPASHPEAARFDDWRSAGRAAHDLRRFVEVDAFGPRRQNPAGEPGTSTFSYRPTALAYWMFGARLPT